jgi:hypothetical protein
VPEPPPAGVPEPDEDPPLGVVVPPVPPLPVEGALLAGGVASLAAPEPDAAVPPEEPAVPEPEAVPDDVLPEGEAAPSPDAAASPAAAAAGVGPVVAVPEGRSSICPAWSPAPAA